MVDSIVDLEPGLVIYTGDLVARGHSADDWDTFFEIEGESGDVSSRRRITAMLNKAYYEDALRVWFELTE